MGKPQADATLVRLATAKHNLVTRAKLNEQRCRAAVLASGGFVSHLAAAGLFDFRRIQPDGVEVTVTRRRLPKLNGVMVHWTRSLAGTDRTSIGGIPVTSPARTLLDIIALVTPEVYEGALDDVLVRHLAHLRTLEKRLEGVSDQGRPGIDRLRRLVAERSEGARGSESPLEDELLAVIRRYGLPLPKRQHSLVLPSGRRIRMDGAYTDSLVDVEADGRRHHAGHADSRADRARDEEGALLGWTVLRFTARDIRSRPLEVAQLIAAALGLPAPGLILQAS